MTAATAGAVTEQLIEMADRLGPSGTLAAVGHGWVSPMGLGLASLDSLAAEPALAQHAATLIVDD